MTRDSTQLIAAVTVVVAILASITVVTEILTPEGNDTVQGDWYLTELYSLEDGRRVIEHSMSETRSGDRILTISVENGNMITGVFHDGHVTGTVEGDTINCSFIRDGLEIPCQGSIRDGMILVSTLCSSTVDGRTIIYAVETSETTCILHTPVANRCCIYSLIYNSFYGYRQWERYRNRVVECQR